MVPRAVVAVGVAAVLLGGCGSSDSAGKKDSGTTTAAAGSLGLDGTPIDPGMTELANNAGRQLPKAGVLLTKIPAGSPAAKLGLVAGGFKQADIVSAVDGKDATVSSLSKPLAGHQPGDTVTIHVWHADGSQEDLRLTLK